MFVEKNILVEGTSGRPMPTDIFFVQDGIPKPVVIYAHGFNGFKDWGFFDLIARQYANAGFVFIKFNFSHNGTTPEHPEEFTDLDAYGHNNYSIELNDLGMIIDWALNENNPYASEINKQQLSLIGHSRGGGIVILKAAEDSRIKALVTWASVAECKTPWGNWPETKINEWRETGVQYIVNSRTKQEIPLYFQLYEDYQKNHKRLDIEANIQTLTIPILICHGRMDEAVPVEKAYLLKEWQPNASLLINDSNHVFDRKHPWANSYLPEPMQQVVDAGTGFLKMNGQKP